MATFASNKEILNLIKKYKENWIDHVTVSGSGVIYQNYLNDNLQGSNNTTLSFNPPTVTVGKKYLLAIYLDKGYNTSSGTNGFTGASTDYLASSTSMTTEMAQSYLGFIGSASNVYTWLKSDWVGYNPDGSVNGQGTYYSNFIQAVLKVNTNAAGNLRIYYYPILDYCGLPLFDDGAKMSQFFTALDNYIDNPNGFTEDALESALNGSANPKTGDPNVDNDPDGTSENVKDKGGKGNRDHSSDITGIPDLPEKSGTDAGFTTLYAVNSEVLRALASQLYSNNAWDIIVNYFSSITDAIVGLAMIPYIPDVSGRANHRIGLLTLDVALTTVGSQYKKLDFGNLEIAEYYGSCFDYSPYTRIEIYLPFIGTRTLDTDEVMGWTINVTYHCDCYSGACVAYVSRVTEQGLDPRYVFSGNIAQQIPIASASYDTMISNAVQLACVAATGIVGSAAGAGVAAAEAGGATDAAMGVIDTAGANFLASSASNSASNAAGISMDTVMSGKPTVTRGGQLGSGTGALSPQKPFIVRTIPRQSIPSNYIDFFGYPSNEHAYLSDLDGFAKVEDIHLNNIPATEPEKNEIMALLKGGVLL